MKTLLIPCHDLHSPVILRAFIVISVDCFVVFVGFSGIFLSKETIIFLDGFALPTKKT
jgi:hypothetical protein